ncbi:hypothetical protein A8L34_20705 [Bacillus sp. FJAT-27264]|uniref:DUF6271 family protein n=1 Tax=Paenibacillus sp. (strain DSM 101736 / FJAT-27264) TaxID=1850362 RepID=UPI00080814E1|nr:DUF6271 family protein [Bacillus sp. FJAT-27264]OBZ09699.1 hypothetical protein A8L34_20705 [Bacillus sp. FJAT-27264]
MFAIPTNRPVLAAAQSILREMTSMRKRGMDPEELIILDNGPSPVVEQNRRDIEELRKETSIPIIYHDLDDQMQWIRELAEQSGRHIAELTSLLYPFPGEGDYGKVFNMIYLAAARYGRKVVHRRDSDCFAPQGDEELYPVWGEIQFIGKRVAEIQHLTDTCEPFTAAVQQEEIWIAGSDYTGNWNVNIESLQERNEQTLPELLRILSIPDARIPDYITAKYSDDHLSGRSRPLLITCQHAPDVPEIVPYYPECGNIAMKEIFEWIPNFIGSRCIGFDYHTYILGALLKVPAVYHTNRIIHAHDNSRKALDGTYSYWKGMAKLADYNLFITEFRIRYLDQIAPEGVNGFRDLKEQGSSTLVRLLSECHAGLDRSARLGLIHDLVHRLLLPSGLAEYLPVAEELERRAEELVDELDDDYRRSIALQAVWQELVEISRRVGSPYVQA